MLCILYVVDSQCPCGCFCCLHIFLPETECPRTREVNERLNASFIWPETTAGDFYPNQCPCRDAPELTNGLFAIRECGTDGSWLQTDFSVCISDTRMALCEVRMCICVE